MADTGKIIALAKAVAPKMDPEAITQAVDDWLDENITNPDSPPLDRSLTSSYAAAPADIVGDLAEAKASTNLYDKDSCNPVDGKSYWNGGLGNNASYATTGKIPVEASTQYIFYAGGVRVKYCEYFSGDSGGTFLSRETLDDAAFTTPSGCTYVAIMLFATSHTTAQYDAAIAAGQLNKGFTVLPFEPFGNTYYVPFDSMEEGDKLKGISNVSAVQPGVNLYDKSLAENGKYYYTDGSVQTGEKYAISGLIPVSPNTQYCVSKDETTALLIISAVYEFNSSGEFIGTITTGLYGYVYSYLLSFATGSTTRYIAFNMYTTSTHTEQEFKDTIDTLMLTYGTMRPHSYSAYKTDTVILSKGLDNAYFNPDCFAGKTWLATGTSITWYDGKKYQAGVHLDEVCRGYVGNVTRRKRLKVINEGINGSTLGNVNANSLINRYSSLDWENADIATLEYGVNDLGNNIPVGTASDAAGNSTFAACLKTVIEYALAQNPQIRLVICTEPDVRGTTANNNGNTLKDFTDVTLAIAEQYRLPVCDWYYHAGINALNKGDTTKDWMTCDGTHPNDAGQLRMAAMLNQVFDRLIC